MRLTIESTPDLVTIDGVPCRRWIGRTEGGIAVEVYVHRVAVEEKDVPRLQNELGVLVPVPEPQPPVLPLGDANVDDEIPWGDDDGR